MITINENPQLICLTKLERSKVDPCNFYYFILHNNYTKEIWVLKVRDINSNPVRYNLYIELPDYFETGEYTYYLVSYDNWDINQISSNYPADSQFLAAKQAVTGNDMYIVSGDTMLVTSHFKAKLMLKGKDLLWQAKELTIKKSSEDESPYGKIVKEVNVLNSGILKYQPEEKICCDNFIEYDGGESEKYIQYNG